MTATKVELYNSFNQAAKLKDFNELHSYTMNLPTKDNLANQISNIFIKHNNLNELVLKNYVTTNDMEVYIEEQNNQLKSNFISQEVWSAHNRVTKSSFDSMYEHVDQINVKMKDFQAYQNSI